MNKDATEKLCLSSLLALIIGIKLLDKADQWISPEAKLLAFLLIGVGSVGVVVYFYVEIAAGRFWRTRADRKSCLAVMFGFLPGVNKVRQSFEVMGWLVFALGEPSTFLDWVGEISSGRRESDLCVSCAHYVFSVVLFRYEYFTSSGPIHLTGWLKILVLVSMGAVVSMFSFGVVLLSNGVFDQPAEVRRVPLVNMRVLKGKTNTYYVWIRPWPNSGEVRQYKVAECVYSVLKSDSLIGLVMGKGTLGIEWVRSIELVKKS